MSLFADYFGGSGLAFGTSATIYSAFSLHLGIGQRPVSHDWAMVWGATAIKIAVSDIELSLSLLLVGSKFLSAPVRLSFPLYAHFIPPALRLKSTSLHVGYSIVESPDVRGLANRIGVGIDWGFL